MTFSSRGLIQETFQDVLGPTRCDDQVNVLRMGDPKVYRCFQHRGRKSVWDLELDSALTCMIYTYVYTHYIYNIYIYNVCVCVYSVSRLVVSGSLRGLYPARLLCPWNSPVKNTEVGSHFLLQGNLPYPGIEPCLDSVLRPFLEAGQFIVLSN